MKKLVLLVVIFKESINCAATIKSLKKCSDSKLADLFIWDNSPSEFSQEDLLNFKFNDAFKSVRYLRTPLNTSLSGIYNSVANEYFNDKKYDLLCLFDQDSLVSFDFISEILNFEHLNTEEALLIVPSVISGSNQLISPRVEPKIKYFFNKSNLGNTSLYKRGTMCSTESFFAVGSGLVISSSLWATGIKFDNTLSFYGVDKEFCISYSQINGYFYLLNSTINHDVSHDNKESPLVTLWRYDNVMYYRKYQYFKYTKLPRVLIELYFSLHRKLKLLFLTD